ncbi:hypothetical protein OG909_32905 (plasmid) [Streptomyces sp. NBC_01754]|uniref:hypothetical protein n=1 Tax=Streptomyces sp. NBC_01754 TaxID=2975930 RepID=UPI002DDA2866|nr:hypothetical protein [Streptomyces sp. NBC_01754]WSC97106.1 hypothetical protein OG909_32905 [Streptomyces sp. NBC_01754]
MDDSIHEGAPVPAAAYAAALREAVGGFTARGGTQRTIASAAHIAPATLSRYLSGERVAPRGFLQSLRSFLAEQGQPLDAETYARLDGLCGMAHAASGSPAVQLLQLRDEIARLGEEQGRAHHIAETRLAELEAQTSLLARQLQEALDRVEKQNESLRHAQDYTHQIEAELAEQQEQAHLLRQEVSVLREQNRRLVEEQTGTLPEVSTQASHTEAVPVQRQKAATATDPFGTLPHLDRPGRPAPKRPSPALYTPPYSLGPDPRDYSAADYLLKPAKARVFFCIALTTYMSWILWLAFLVALESDQRPSGPVLDTTAVVALVVPYLFLGLLSGLGRLVREGIPRLCRLLLAVQAVTFAGWISGLMGPVFVIVGADRAALWIATQVLL